MRSSYSIFKIFGISIELHITFILFLLVLPLISLDLFYLWIIIFMIVLFHELSHSVMALVFKIRVPRITLTPIGGLASIDVPEEPVKEFLISLAGPLSNFFLMIVILFAFLSMGTPLDDLLNYEGDIEITNLPSLLSGLFWINFVLGAFNMLPGFPMDGGRVFRAFLAFFMDYIKATRIAVAVGRIISVFFIVVGLFTLPSNPILIVIGLFLYFAGGQELKVLQIKRALSGMAVGDIAIPQVRYVNELETVKNFTELVADPGQDYYPVTDHEGRVVGILEMESLRGVDESEYNTLKVGSLSRKRIDVIDAGAGIDNVLQTLLTKDFILVVREKKIIGYLTQDHLLEVARFYGIRGIADVKKHRGPD